MFSKLMKKFRKSKPEEEEASEDKPKEVVEEAKPEEAETKPDSGEDSAEGGNKKEGEKESGDSDKESSKDAPKEDEGEDSKSESKDEPSEEKADEETKEEKKDDKEDPEKKTDSKEAKDQNDEADTKDEKQVKLVTKSGVTTIASTEKLAETVQAQLVDTNRNDYWVIRIRKQTALIALGVALLTMWLVPLFGLATERGVLQNIASHSRNAVSSISALINRGDDSEEVEEASEDITRLEREEIRIRVKYSDSEENAQAVSDRLSEWSYQVLDVIEEEEINVEEGIQIVVKRDQEALRAFIEADLSQIYQVASSSAELTDDSDFDAIIIVGEAIDKTESESPEAEDTEENEE